MYGALRILLRDFHFFFNLKHVLNIFDCLYTSAEQYSSKVRKAWSKRTTNRMRIGDKKKLCFTEFRKKISDMFRC